MMIFTKSVEWIFQRVEERVPPPDKTRDGKTFKARQKYFRAVRLHIFRALRDDGSTAALLRKRTPSKRNIEPRTILSADAFAMRRGVFKPKGERLTELEKWKGAQIRVLTKVANRAVRTANQFLVPDFRRRGAPSKIAKASKIYKAEWPKNHKEHGLTNKQALQVLFKKHNISICETSLRAIVKKLNPTNIPRKK